MQHAHTIAMARRLLAKGRAAEVARMIEPLLPSGNGKGTPEDHDAGEAVLRSLLARIRLLRYGDALQAEALLRPYATPEATSDLPAVARAEVLLWRGWLYAWPDLRTQRLPEALVLLTEAAELFAARHDALGRCWALLGQAACYLALDESAQLQRTLDAADAAVHPLLDVQARLVHADLDLAAACLRGDTSQALTGVERLIELGRDAHDPAAEGQGYAYRAQMLLNQDAAPDEVLAEAQEAETLLTHSMVPPGSALLRAVEIQISALLRAGQPAKAQRLLDRTGRTLEHVPGATARLTHERARIALYEERFKDALQWCQEAHTRLSHPRSPRETARLFLTQAEATASAGDVQQARQLATQALHKASNLADRVLAHQVQTLIGRLPSPEPADDGPADAPLPLSTDAVPCELVYASPSMHAVAEAAHQAARGYHAVLITGERGSGKERIARAVHAQSARRAQPFVAFDSTTMPSDIVAQALLGEGHTEERSATRTGAMLRAQRGTLFIKEVADLPRDVQSMLAHALDEGAIVPPGSRTSIPIDIRLIAATSRDLQARVEAGTFHAGLYARLQIIRLHLPPLRDRRDDIPLLAHHVLGTLQAKGTPLAAITDQAFDALKHYDWPGNLRQLRNELERALAQIRSEPAPVIDLKHLSPLLRESATPSLQHDVEALELAIRPGLSLDDLLARAEKSIIQQVLTEQAGHVSASAQALGLTRQGLYKKMKRLDIDPSTFQPSSADAVTAS